MAYAPCYNIMIGDNPDLHLHLAEVYALKEVCESIIREAEKQAGIFSELVQAGQELGDTPATVCVTHRRFVPCRKNDGCVLSDVPEDVARVAEYHKGKE